MNDKGRLTKDDWRRMASPRSVFLNINIDRMPSFDIRHSVFMIRYSLLNTNLKTSICNTRPKFLLRSDWTLAAIQGGARMKLRRAEQWTDWTSNIEHPTSNVEYWWRYALSVLKQAHHRVSKGRFVLFSLFKIGSIHYSMLDVQCSVFDVHFLVNPLYETWKSFFFD